LSRDVIKRSEFRELFTREADRSVEREARGAAFPLGAAGAVTDGDEAESASTGGRYTSARVRFRELLTRLEEAEERERRNVEKAREEAREEALAEARAEYEEVVEMFRRVAARMQATVDREVELATGELVDVATAIASKIVRREIRADDEYVLRLVRRCLGKILQPSAVRVRLHPEDRDRVAASAASLSAEAETRHQLSFEADRRVERGGCVVETPDFIVDARRDTQLAAAAAAMGGNA